jgi:shikimate dehydrogenase
VDGSTRLLVVLGDPIAQVRSPAAWTALFAHNGVNAACVPLHVRPADLGAVFAGLRAARNVQAVIATIPHKPAMLELVDEPSARAVQVGSVNAVAFDAERRARGDILDGQGSAIAFALAAAGCAEVAVHDIDTPRAERLAARLTHAGYAARSAEPDPRGYDVVVNATPLGMRPADAFAFDVGRLNDDTVVADVVVAQSLTPLLQAARARGCFVHPGVLMSDAQVARMAEFFDFGAGDWSAERIAELLLKKS